MSSVRDRILARAAAALTGSTPAGANVFRSREVAITKGVTPAVVVQFAGESTDRFGDFTDKHLMRMDVLIFSRGDPWDSITDTVEAPAHAVLMADAPLRALVLDIRRTGAEPESEEADRTAGVMKASFLVTYLTKAGDITAQPT